MSQKKLPTTQNRQSKNNPEDAVSKTGQVEILASEDEAQRIMEQAKQSGGQVTFAQIAYEGLTPHSSEIKVLHELNPAYAQQVLDICEREHKGKFDINARAMRFEFCASIHGHLFGFAGFLSVIGLAVWLVTWLVEHNAPYVTYSIPLALIGIHAFGTIRKFVDGRKK